MNSTEKHVRTNLTIAASGKFKDEVLHLALAKNTSVSQFVRDALCKAYPKLQQVDGPSEYALKRNIRLQQIQERKETMRKQKSDDDLISFR
ncbi:TPA: hypothetical protein QDB15_006463 [Burkholderia vietnamiensis]|uniref:hypothetical protein n=1 Tax=Burkholderia vietnamiensis TaxID=60552 RepID=UPI0012D9B615|nr:hypothetical protein [Burkholderia vietnamiensis]MBR8161640.1 hypothetical protein [Burkholderia vietnamiensis]MCA7946727.1 hypothetical protein [Burkholderia vietnamiensis]MCA8212006.1 hypothetical protein [Burkholderia vietnamiensis]MDN7413069.1 hypothetical protein [Burkholderia vietnamiensis]HDR9102756.1 hypothetical protein [Burkholderia vietnamiensis]